MSAIQLAFDAGYRYVDSCLALHAQHVISGSNIQSDEDFAMFIRFGLAAISLTIAALDGIVGGASQKSQQRADTRNPQRVIH